jgi:1-acyl-sn-glycerol-3-phosphate acyltransferase
MALEIFPGLPRTDRLPRQRHLLLKGLRHPMRWLMTHYWDVVITGTENLPAGGPMILVGNHAGLIDGPLLVVLHPQPTFALAKVELFSGPLGKLLDHVGQISIDRRRADTACMTRSIHLLRNGGVLAIFPEGKRTAGRVRHAGRGAAYLAMVTGAPVVPVALLGTRGPDQTKNHIPGRGSLINISYGRPMHIPAVGWPRTKLAVAEWTERIRLELSDHVVARQQLTGLSLPSATARKHMKSAA